MTLTDQRLPPLRRSWWRQVFTAGAAIAAVVAVNSSAKADFRDGNRLYTDCAGHGVEGLYCIAYIDGIADEMRHDRILGRTACVPEHAMAGQLQAVVEQFLTVHSKFRHLGGVSLVADALAEAFPCSQ